MINYSTLIDTTSLDDVREHGSLTVDEALNLFETFDFHGAISKLADNPNLMRPTITFQNVETSESLAIWLNSDETYEIWVPNACVGLSDIITKDLIKRCISAFFDSDLQRVCKLLEPE